MSVYKSNSVKAGSYSRLSREDGDKLESDSIRNQRDLISDYAARKGISIAEEYIDDGYSGTNFNRPSFIFCMVFGVPFGIPYMLFVVPIGGSISRGVGILALNAIIGALFGCVIAAVVMVKAVGYLVWWSCGSVIRLFRRG